MTARGYVQIRPGTDPPIRVICKPCGLDQPSPRWHTALHDTKTHNHEHHGTP
jgi:hypothetical protein